MKFPSQPLKWVPTFFFPFYWEGWASIREAKPLARVAGQVGDSLNNAGASEHKPARPDAMLGHFALCSAAASPRSLLTTFSSDYYYYLCLIDEQSGAWLGNSPRSYNLLLTSKRVRSWQYIGWPKSSFTVLHKPLWKNLKDTFVQPRYYQSILSESSTCGPPSALGSLRNNRCGCPCGCQAHVCTTCPHNRPVSGKTRC